MKEYTLFWSSKKPYSNWYPCQFTYKGIKFHNSEQAYMWEKALCFGDEETAEQILEEGSDPKIAKDLGRMVVGFDSLIWDDRKFQIMYDIVLEKFRQNPTLKKKLLQNSNFVEASPYDLIWGVGLSEDDPRILDEKNWKGQNLLGKVLEKVKLNFYAESYNKHTLFL